MVIKDEYKISLWEDFFVNSQMGEFAGGDTGILSDLQYKFINSFSEVMNANNEDLSLYYELIYDEDETSKTIINSIQNNDEANPDNFNLYLDGFYKNGEKRNSTKEISSLQKLYYTYGIKYLKTRDTEIIEGKTYYTPGGQNYNYTDFIISGSILNNYATSTTWYEIINGTYQEYNKAFFDFNKIYYNGSGISATGLELNCIRFLLRKDNLNDFILRNCIPAHYDERKISDIGSSEMDTGWRAIEPKIVENVNGSNTLTFKMYHKYRDNLTGEIYDNPFISKIFNESKIKLYWKNKWYDFVVKNIQEDSTDYSTTFTCKELFIHELSKNGYNLEFDTELENNIGTVTELGEQVLEDTDWEVDKENSDVFEQEKEEAVYEFTIPNPLINAGYDNINLITDKQILISYSQIQNILNIYKETKDVTKLPNIGDIQFIYAGEQNETTTKFITKDNLMIVTNGICITLKQLNDSVKTKTWWQFSQKPDGISYLTAALVKSDDSGSLAFFRIPLDGSLKVSSDYTANFIVNSQKTYYDPYLQRLVKVYTDSAGQTVYGYEDIKFKEPLTLVQNLVTNSKDFSDKDIGWDYSGFYGTSTLARCSSGEEEFNCLYISGSGDISNSGIYDNLSTTLQNGLQLENKYIVRCKLYQKTENTSNVSDGYNKVSLVTERLDFNPTLRYLDQNNQQKVIFQDSDSYNCVNGWHTWTFTINNDLNFTALQLKNNQMRLEFEIGQINSVSLFIREVQFFKEVKGKKSIKNETTGEIEQEETLSTLYPEDYEVSSCYVTERKFYYPEQSLINQNDLDNIRYCYITYDVDDTTYTPIYSTEKQRTLTGSKSNRFNLIQNLAETFECWPVFVIQHDENGKISLDSNSKRQLKSIKFVKEKGNRLGYGFEYGIDLKNIRRNIVSDQIVTKTIVEPNNNEHAKNKQCTIQRASENFSKQNFILNFDYYISHGLIDSKVLYADLWGNFETTGLYPQLRNLSEKYDSIVEKDSQAIIDELTIENDYKLAKTSLESNLKLMEEAFREVVAHFTSIDYYADYVGESIDKISLKNIPYTEKNKEFFSIPNLQEIIFSSTSKGAIDFTTNIERIIKVNSLFISQVEKKSYNFYKDEVERLSVLVPQLEKKINDIKESRDKYKQDADFYLNEIEKLVKDFERKYSRYIFEGTWISEDYIDDNLYYFDAVQVAYTSSRPQVSYDISVARLSALPEFYGKNFNVGDISYVKDTNFFGYLADGITPYKEEVLISEITSYLDTPDKDVLKIQNYKTQFEDLFQRITATTQSLQYAQGQYNKVSNTINPDGTIKESVLQDSINNNNKLVISSQNNLVTSDNTGITVIDQSNKNFVTKLTAAGLLTSIDGGKNWITGVSAQTGINTSLLTAGKINTNEIELYDGNALAFRWDDLGINAFAESGDTTDYSTFVRFDKYGIYGIKGSDYTNDNPFMPEDEEDVWMKASFALTWKGFSLKSSDGTGGITIDSDNNNIKVLKNGSERIIIGQYKDEGGNSSYGIVIKNLEGTSVFSTDLNGNLSITGKINAVAGGTIGGFEINENYLTSTDGSLILNSADKTIQIGKGSKNILLDGVNSRIEGNNFYIESNGAKFENIDVAGTIRTAVFEADTIQSVGGAMLFKDAAQVDQELTEEYSGTGDRTIYIKNSNSIFSTNDYVLLSKYSNNLKGELVNEKVIRQISETNNNQIVFYRTLDGTNKDFPSWIPDTITKIANFGSNDTLLIGVNSSSINNGLLYPQGFSFIDINGDDINGNKLTSTNSLFQSGELKLFLGNLNSIKEDEIVKQYFPNIEGYGLYCDNVYLKGKLSASNFYGNSFYDENTEEIIETPAIQIFSKEGFSFMFPVDSNNTQFASMLGIDSTKGLYYRSPVIKISNNNNISMENGVQYYEKTSDLIARIQSIESFTQDQIEKWDTNGDGKINSRDIAAIMREDFFGYVKTRDTEVYANVDYYIIKEDFQNEDKNYIIEIEPQKVGGNDYYNEYENKIILNSDAINTDFLKAYEINASKAQFGNELNTGVYTMGLQVTGTANLCDLIYLNNLGGDTISIQFKGDCSTDSKIEILHESTLNEYNENDLALSIPYGSAYIKTLYVKKLVYGDDTYYPTALYTSAERVVSFMRTNNTIPATVNVTNVNNITFSLKCASFLYLMCKQIVNISNKEKIYDLDDVEASLSSNPAYSGGNGAIIRSSYVSEATQIINFIQSHNNTFPQYSTIEANSVLIGNNNLVYMYARILAYYHKNSILPDSIEVKSWGTQLTTADNSDILAY